VFHRTECAGKDFSIVHFPLHTSVLPPDDGRMKDRNMYYKIIIDESVMSGCCVCVDWIVNDDLEHWYGQQRAIRQLPVIRCLEDKLIISLLDLAYYLNNSVYKHVIAYN
jgi:hypothetical protein